MKIGSALAGLLSISALVHCRSAIGFGSVQTIKESLPSVPEGWETGSAPDASSRLQFRVAVTRAKPKLLEQTLYAVSTPGNPRYGLHVKREELKEILRPTTEATESIIAWLRASGIDEADIEEKGDWINFVASVEKAEQILSAQFRHYRSKTMNHLTRIRTLQYSVPESLDGHIRMIQPTTRFGQIRAQDSTVFRVEKADEVKIPDAPSDVNSVLGTAGLNVTLCNATITPQCLKDLYQTGNFKASSDNGNLLGVNGFLEQYARYADLTEFETLYAQSTVGQNFSFQSVNGGLLDQTSAENSVEANLDIQYTVGISAPTPQRFYSTAGRGPLVPDLDQPDPRQNSNEPYLEFFTYLSDLDDEELPTVISTSYGEDEQSVPAEYAKSVCDLIGGLGARGVSVIFSSGDTGVGSACQTNDGKNTTRFLPIFPAACPYVTSVGGTYQVQPERAISFSSGGFSDIWGRPTYQDVAVKKYLSILGNRWQGLYNPEGRGFPDIAAQSYRFNVIDKGSNILVGGTSASGPVIAGIIALLNSARLDAGKPPLGFLNPWLYSEGYKGLMDIVNGGSRGCTGRSIYSGLSAPLVPYASWNATEGWDPVTGYGTPIFPKLLELAAGGGYGYGYGRYRRDIQV